eukprot:TRINITY_DN25959_c0_g1_i6.p2 TRINITY_DN25959_c0_g1~~TRINITY_DN25959_c0_g1_i6.p2  ORF type:complete len:303 (+),score=89.95 TRINITY_DN25959_c0_g1_i6:275-1183(+)
MKLAPITAALQKGHRSTFRRMLEMGIDVNFRDADGTTLLLSCLDATNRLVYDEVKFMLSKGADPTLKSSAGVTVMHKVAAAGGYDLSSCFAPHPFEAERLAAVKGWAPRPKQPEIPSEEDEEDEETDSEDEKSAEEAKKRKEQRQKAREERIKKPYEAAGPPPEKIYERGLWQLSTEQREAVFRLGFTEQSWQQGVNPVAPWKDLDDAKKAAAKTVGLDEVTWQVIPVKVLAGTCQEKNGTSGRRSTTRSASLTRPALLHVRFSRLLAAPTGRCKIRVTPFSSRETMSTRKTVRTRPTTRSG